LKRRWRVCGRSWRRAPDGVRWLLPIVFVPALLISCSSTSEDLVARDIVAVIPWQTPETAHYRLLQGDDVRGSGQLSVKQAGGVIVIEQAFEFPDIEVTDRVVVEADPESLRPSSVERVIDGPEGRRECLASYAGGTVTIEQKTQDDERTDELSLPPQHYDSWTDLFLWRTIEFSEGQEERYVDVSSCSLAKPELISPRLSVKKVEEVTVPAGTFQAWRLEFRAEGRTQEAWYADDEQRMLVRYDNGDLVFELESID
jgi:Protein of unknown function (DUF3108)